MVFDSRIELLNLSDKRSVLKDFILKKYTIVFCEVVRFLLTVTECNSGPTYWEPPRSWSSQSLFYIMLIVKSF